MQKPVVEPPQGVSRLEPGGCGPVSSARPPICTGDSGPGVDARQEATVKACGVVVARLQEEKLGAHPVNRSMVNVGTAAEPPHLSPSRGESGKARRQLMTRQRDGALVVVRGRESRLHGEGGQRVRNHRTGMPGGRRRISTHRCRASTRRSSGYWRSRRSCTDGPSTTHIIASMTSTTWCVTRHSWWLPGTGSGATRGHGRQESME